MGQLHTPHHSTPMPAPAERKLLPCGAERRRMPRHAIGSQVNLQLLEPAPIDAQEVIGYARNLSVGGACLYSRRRLIPGQQVRVIIPLEREGTNGNPPPCFEGLATVLRANPIDARFTAIALRYDCALSGKVDYAAFITRYRDNR